MFKLVFSLILFAMLLTSTGYAVLRDPTRPAEVVGGAGTGLSAAQGILLTTVLYSEDRKLAIINGIVVKVGDTVGGAKILNIKPNEVVLETANETFTLKMSTVDVKKPVRKDR